MSNDNKLASPPKFGVHSKRAQKQGTQIFRFQLMIVIVVAAICLVFNQIAAYSALIGGLIWLVANAYATKRALGEDCSGKSAHSVLALLYVSEIWKVGICITLFGLTFLFVKPISPLSLFSTFILMQVVYSLAQMKLFDRFLKL